MAANDCLVNALGYIGLGSRNIDAWRAFASNQLGMEVIDGANGSLRLRMDEKTYRYVLEPGDENRLACVGFEVGDAAKLEALKSRLEQAGYTVSPSSDAERATRDVSHMQWVLDPDGTRIEFYVGQREAGTPFSPSKPIGGFVTGALGMGHFVRYTPRFREMSAFYQTVLGFRLSDFHHHPFSIEFLRVNPRHHSMGLIEDAGQPRLHHAMVEYAHWDDVGRAYDVALSQPESIAVTLGRHLNDHMTSFYVWTPDAFFIEVGWAGRTVDEASWQVEEINSPSLWGHVRNWQTEEKRIQTRKLIEAVGAGGIRAPIAVSGEGPFTLPSKGK